MLDEVHLAEAALLVLLEGLLDDLVAGPGLHEEGEEALAHLANTLVGREPVRLTAAFRLDLVVDYAPAGWIFF